MCPGVRLKCASDEPTSESATGTMVGSSIWAAGSSVADPCTARSPLPRPKQATEAWHGVKVTPRGTGNGCGVERVVRRSCLSRAFTGLVCLPRELRGFDTLDRPLNALSGFVLLQPQGLGWPHAGEGKYLWWQIPEGAAHLRVAVGVQPRRQRDADRRLKAAPPTMI
eukprot:4612466-Prymnesium_polylepis.1